MNFNGGQQECSIMALVFTSTCTNRWRTLRLVSSRWKPTCIERKGLRGSFVHREVTPCNLLFLSSVSEANYRYIAKFFSFIALFKAGNCDINPEIIRVVLAPSIGDSIFVASALLADLSEGTSKHVVQRVFSNLSWSELTLLLTSPFSKPKIQEYDFQS